MSRKFAVLAAVVALGISTAAIAADEVLLVAPAAAPIQQTSGTVNQVVPVVPPTSVVVPPTSVAPPTSVHVTNQPVPTSMQPVPFQEAAPLFTKVKVRDPRRIACNSVPMVVTVKDPCACKDVCNTCGPKCVNVLVCVPGCTECPPKVTCKRDGAFVRYDFGKYRVEVRSRKGFVEIDYDGPKTQAAL
jgi:hypothetical protein